MVSHHQEIRFRVDLYADNRGTKETERYRGMATFFYDNVLTLNDNFWFSPNHGLGDRCAGARGMQN